METEMKHPDAKKHLIVSLVKSAVRIGGCILAVTTADAQHAVFVLAVAMGLAEVIGVYEELV